VLPFRGRVAEPLDTNAAGQATFDGSFDEVWCEECERDGHIDLTHAPFLARGDLLNISDLSLTRSLIISMSVIPHLSQQCQWWHFVGRAFDDHIRQPDVLNVACTSHSSMFRLLQQLFLESSPVLSLRPKQE
jgi:hypothetical protein